METWLSTCDLNDWKDLGQADCNILFAAWWPPKGGRRIFCIFLTYFLCISPKQSSAVGVLTVLPSSYDLKPDSTAGAEPELPLTPGCLPGVSCLASQKSLFGSQNSIHRLIHQTARHEKSGGLSTAKIYDFLARVFLDRSPNPKKMKFIQFWQFPELT